MKKLSFEEFFVKKLSFDEFWQAMRPSEPAPPSPDWPPELSRNLLVGMRQENDFIDALCAKYELQ